MTSAVSPSYAKHYGMGLIAPARAIDIDLSRPVGDTVVGQNYRGVLGLVRHAESVVGSVILPVRDGILEGEDVLRIVREELGDAWLLALARRRLEGPLPEHGIDSIGELLATPLPAGKPSTPSVTVIVCTRDRTPSLRKTLRALTSLDYPAYEVLVVDNAPSDIETRDLVAGEFPAFRYVQEPQAGLSHARNRGVAAAKGEILAFTDDDALPDRLWLRQLVAPFAADASVAAVTGLTVPLVLDLEPQIIAETHRSFDRGYRRRWYRIADGSRDHRIGHFAATRFGAGVNMALRKDALKGIGLFDLALGAGSKNHAGEDPDMFFRVLESGSTLVYEPSAVVRHVHRSSWDELERQWAGWARGYFAYLVRTLRRGYRRPWALAGFVARELGRYFRATVAAHLHPVSMPRSLVRAELKAAFSALGLLARMPGRPGTGGRAPGNPVRRFARQTAVRHVDLAQPVGEIDDASSFESTLIHVALGEKMLGSVRIANCGATISRAQLLDEIAAQIDVRLFADGDVLAPAELRSRFINDLAPFKPRSGRPATAKHGRAAHAVSVVIATRDRPDRLRECLDSLARQGTDASLQVIVVDNNPASGLTPPVVEGFHGVRLLEERNGGASAARNRGMLASDGEIVALIDDDVVVPAHWVESVRRAFARADVGLMAGNVLARTLARESQEDFERNYGFGRGFLTREYGPQFFEAQRFNDVPVSSLGAGAMLAVRRSVLAESGLFSETLGPGTPARAGEDLYFIYRVAKTSWTILYNPHAWGLHYHRATRRELYRQIFNYGVGYYAHLTATLFRNGDLRSLIAMLVAYPRVHVSRLFGRRRHSRLLTVLEFAGNLAGPFLFLASAATLAFRRAAPVPVQTDEEQRNKELKNRQTPRLRRRDREQAVTVR